MTYITFDIFKKMCLYGKIHDEYEYKELYRRKIVPTNLIPTNPAKYYKKPSAKRPWYTHMFEKKHGRKCNWRDKDDVIEYRQILKQVPEYKVKLKAYQKKRRSTPEYKAKRKAYCLTPEYKAKQKARRSTPEYKAKQKAYCLTHEYKAKHRANQKAFYHKHKNDLHHI